MPTMATGMSFRSSSVSSPTGFLFSYQPSISSRGGCHGSRWGESNYRLWSLSTLLENPMVPAVEVAEPAVGSSIQIVTRPL